MATLEPELSLSEARAIVNRALDKARQLKQTGAIAVMDSGGGPVSISRMEGSSAHGASLARAKAFVAAVQRAPSVRSATMWRESPAIFSSFQRLMRDEIFPGEGAMPIRKGQHVVGGVAVGGGIGPWTEIPGVDSGLLAVDGKPANAEDLIIFHALQIPYESQHGPDGEVKRVGRPATTPEDDLPHTLRVARDIADRALAAAVERGVRVGVAVVDEVGNFMQMDRMDWAAPMAPDLAEAKAQTALNFQRPTRELADVVSAEVLAQIQEIAHYKLLAAPGGVPIVRNGIVLGAIGVSGVGDQTDDEVARAAVQSWLSAIAAAAS